MRVQGKTVMNAAACIALMCGALSGVFAGQPLLTGLSVHAGDRGVALVVETDQPCAADFVLTSTRAAEPALEVRLPGVVYGLEEYAYAITDSRSPVSAVAASESDDGPLIVRVTLRYKPASSVRSKQKGEVWFALISAASHPSFRWQTSSPVSDDAVHDRQEQRFASDSGDQQAGAHARIVDIRIIQRSDVEELVVEADKPIQIISKEKGRRVLAILRGAISDFGDSRIAPDIPSAFRGIRVQQSRRRGEAVTGVTVTISPDSPARPIVRIEDQRMVVYVARRGTGAFAIWSARQGKALSYEFAETVAGRVDYDRMSRQARADLQEGVPAGATFRIAAGLGGPPAGASETKAAHDAGRAQANPQSEPGTKKPSDRQQPPADQSPHPPETAAAAAPRRVVIVREYVNFRSEPSAASDESIIMQLPSGTMGTVLERRGKWRRMQTDSDVVGWVFEALIQDSASVPERVWATFKTGNERVETGNAVESSPVQEVYQLERAPEAPPVAETIEDSSRLRPPPVDTANAKPQKKMVIYTIYGRDPFLPLDPESLERSEFPNVESAVLVGVMYDQADKIALVEDQTNREIAYALREGDRVDGGRVLKIEPRRVVFLLTEMGVSRTFSLNFKEKTNE